MESDTCWCSVTVIKKFVKKATSQCKMLQEKLLKLHRNEEIQNEN